MPETGRVSKVYSCGRVYIPTEFHKALNIKLSDPVVVQIGEDVLRLRKVTPEPGKDDLAAPHVG